MARSSSPDPIGSLAAPTQAVVHLGLLGSGAIPGPIGFPTASPHAGHPAVAEPSKPQNPIERTAIMGDVLAEIRSMGYRYNLTKGFSGWTALPPPRGTEINCRAAATLAKRLAEEKHGMEGAFLKVIGFKPGEGLGFIVVATPGMKALGTTDPEISTVELECWEFDNHYRVVDPNGFQKIYDPIFGTSGNFNPTGILSSEKEKSETVGDSLRQISVYGEKYRITRGIGFPTKVDVLKPGPIDPKYIVTDLFFS